MHDVTVNGTVTNNRRKTANILYLTPLNLVNIAPFEILSGAWELEIIFRTLPQILQVLSLTKPTTEICGG